MHCLSINWKLKKTSMAKIGINFLCLSWHHYLNETKDFRIRELLSQTEQQSSKLVNLVNKLQKASCTFSLDTFPIKSFLEIHKFYNTIFLNIIFSMTETELLIYRPFLAAKCSSWIKLCLLHCKLQVKCYAWHINDVGIN